MITLSSVTVEWFDILEALRHSAFRVNLDEVYDDDVAVLRWVADQLERRKAIAKAAPTNP